MSNNVKQPGLLKSFIAGGGGGICLVVVGHPLDTIKVKLQMMKVEPGMPPPYTGVLDCARKTIAEHGPRGLYAGVMAPLAGVTPMYALCFYGYGVGKSIMCDPDAFDAKNPKLLQIGAAGAISAAFTTPILAPGERAKCALQVQTKENAEFEGAVDFFKKTYAREGLRSCLRGFTSTFARDATASFFYFSTYEYLKRLFTRENEDSPSTVATLTAGGFAGIMNWFGCIPIDTLKTRLQVAPTGTYTGTILGAKPVIKDLIKKDGIGALYRGFIPIMLRAFPANAACFLGYETTIKVLTYVGLE